MLSSEFFTNVYQVFFPLHAHIGIGNPGSLSVTRDITRVNYREHMRRSLGLKIC